MTILFGRRSLGVSQKVRGLSATAAQAAPGIRCGLPRYLERGKKVGRVWWHHQAADNGTLCISRLDARLECSQVAAAVGSGHRRIMRGAQLESSSTRREKDSSPGRKAPCDVRAGAGPRLAPSHDGPTLQLTNSGPEIPTAPCSLPGQHMPRHLQCLLCRGSWSWSCAE
jgi:hypothetical protein